jgi:hypothetical protein
MLKAIAAHGLLKDNLVRMGKRQWAQNHRVDHAEDGGGHAHAESQRENHREGKAGRFAQLAKCVAQILKEHPESPIPF